MADHAPQSNAEVKNAWICMSTPPYVFVVWCLITRKDSLAFSFSNIFFSEAQIEGRFVAVLRVD